MYWKFSFLSNLCVPPSKKPSGERSWIFLGLFPKSGKDEIAKSVIIMYTSLTTVKKK